MRPNFQLFGIAHLSIIAAILMSGLLLGRASRANKQHARWIRLTLGTFLALNELVWYVFRLRVEGFRFPEGLPLELCDLTLWLTVIAALSLHQAIFETAYFAGLAGAGMAILTPDIWEPFPSYPTIYFFVAHGILVVTMMTLIIGRVARPRPGCLKRTFIVINLYAAFLAIFNAIFKTNYMYLCRKPENASILDFLGPWPLYIAAGEVVAFALFWLLWLPFRGVKQPAG